MELSELRDKWTRRHMFTDESQGELATEYISKLEAELDAYKDVRQSLLFKKEGLEKQNEALRHTVEDLIVTMKQPAIRGAKTILQMCKFLDVWIKDLEDALLKEE